MVCPKCGKTVPDSAKFCGFCGAKLGGEDGGLVPKQETIAVKPTAAVRPVKVRPEGGAAVAVKPKFSGSKKIILAAAAVVILLAAVLGFVLLGGRSGNAYICLSDGGYQLITDLDQGELVEIASTRSDYGDLWFTPDGKYIYYFSKLDSQYGAGTLCRAEYGRMKANSSKNERYITVVATNASHDFDILEDGTILYTNEDNTLYYFDGETSHQVARDVDFYETEVDGKGNLLYLVWDEDGAYDFSGTMYLTTLQEPEQSTRLDGDVASLLHLTDKGEIAYTRYTEEGVDLYRMTLQDRQPQLVDEDVEVQTWDDDRVLYSVLKEKRGLEPYIEGTKETEQVKRSDYEIPTYTYYYINDAADAAEYDGLCTSIEVDGRFFVDILGGRYSIEEAANSNDALVSEACQAFLTKYASYETNADGFVPVTDAVQADLQLLAQACGDPGNWQLLCIGQRRTGTSYDWDAYNAAADRVSLWEDLLDADQYYLPVYTLKELKDGQSAVVRDDLSICGSVGSLVAFGSIDDLVNPVKVEEITTAADAAYLLSNDMDRYSRVLLYQPEEGETIEMSTADAAMMMDGGSLEQIERAGQYLFVQNGDGVLYVSPIQEGKAASFTVVSDSSSILGVEDDKLYYRDGYYTDDDGGEYADLCVYQNGESSRLLTDVSPYAIWVYEDGSAAAKTYQDLDGTGELVLVDARGNKTTVADEVGSFARADDSHLLYISDEDLYLYDGKEKTRVATDVERIWCRDAMEPVVGAGYYY